MAAGDVEVNLNRPLARRCAVFDGSNDEIQLGSNTFAYGYTIALWLKTGAGGEDPIVEFDTSNSYPVISILSTKMIIWEAASCWQKGNTAINDNMWHHHVFVVNDIKAGGTAKCYLDGSLDNATNDDTDAVATIDETTLMGGKSGNTKGSVCDVQIWNRELSATEVARVYAGQPVTDGLIHRWKLHTDYNDSVGSSNGTNAGTYLTAVDDQVAAAVKADRASANDHYLICEINDKVMTTLIEEA